MYKKMKQFLIATTIISLLLVIMLVYTIELIVLDKFTEGFVSVKREQVDYFIESNLSNLSSLALSNAVWTDTQKALEESNAEWLYLNSTGYLIDDGLYNTDHVSLFSEDFVKVSDYGVDFDRNEDYITLLSSVIKNNVRIKALIIENEDTYFIYGTPTYNNDEENPQGAFVIARLVGDDEIFALTKILGKTNVKNISFGYEYEAKVDNVKNYVNLGYKIDNTSDVSFNAIFDISNYVTLYEVGFFAIFFILAVVATIAVIFVSRLAKRLSNTIVVLIDDIAKISEGDYSIEISHSISDKFEEIETLEKSITKMAGDIGSHINQVTLHAEVIDNQYAEMVNLIVDVVEMNDSYTYHHSFAVSKYARLLGEAVGYKDLESLELASKLHDVGKISIPLSILNKPGSLTREEFDVIKTHPKNGFDLLNKVSVFKEARVGVLYHHEMYDGHGYPYGLKGEDIPLIAQIISVADMYDALTSGRAYRNELSHEEAVSLLIQEKGKALNPRLVDTFLSILEDDAIDTDYIKEYSNKKVNFKR